MMSLKTQIERLGVLCLFSYIDRNILIEQIVLLFLTYSYKCQQFVSLPYSVTLQTTEHRIPILNCSCSFIVVYRRDISLLYLNSTFAILVLSTGI